MRRGRDPSRTPSRPRRPVFDNPRGQLPGTGIKRDAENTVGGLGSEGDKTVLLGPKNWNPISSSKWTLLARHG